MSTIDTYRIAPALPGSRRVGFGSSVNSIFSWIGAMLEYRRTRLALLEMSDDQLKDIGLSRTDAYLEGSRPVWDRIV